MWVSFIKQKKYKAKRIVIIKDFVSKRSVFTRFRSFAKTNFKSFLYNTSNENKKFDSFDYEISDSFSFNFNQKITKIDDETQKSNSAKVIFNIFSKYLIWRPFNLWKNHKTHKKIFEIQQASSFTLFFTKKTSNLAEKNLILQKIMNKSQTKKFLYKKALILWILYTKVCKENMNKTEWNELLSDFSAEKAKVKSQEEIIKKLMRENLSQAYKISNARVKTEDLLKSADKIYSKPNKENKSPLKNKIKRK